VASDPAPTNVLTDEQLAATMATIHQCPSTLLWLEPGGVGHILTGISVALATTVRACSLMPERLGTVVSTSVTAEQPSPAVDTAAD
jgi:hypothetical protein